MDGVLFAAKCAHLGGARFGRRVLRAFGLTPARFDLMNAVCGGVKQSELWRRLGVVRSAVCEMLEVLASLGFVARTRDARDRRTWVIRLTERGRSVFERAYDELVRSGKVTLVLDAILARGFAENDVAQMRFDWGHWALAIAAAFGSRPTEPDIYWSDLSGLDACFAELEDGVVEGRPPFVGDD